MFTTWGTLRTISFMRFRLAISLTFALAALVAVPTALAQEPVAEEPVAPARMVEGTTIARIDVGGMTREEALVTVRTAFAQPIVLTVGGKIFRVTNRDLNARYPLREAVDEALQRTGAGNTPVLAVYGGARFDRQVERILSQSGSKGGEPRWRLTRTTPVVVQGRPGRAAPRRTVELQLRRAIEDPSLRTGQDPIRLQRVQTRATVETLGYVVTVSKSDLKLRLWAPKRNQATAIRTFNIAVGAPAYPTPSGRFTIVNKQVNPWWYPPKSDWARGMKPTPPGPNNPLGTRWMGLDRDAIGIHGTPNAGSLGSYASHGCVRMAINSAEWLFDRVPTGTPVVIY
jgi:lipoprotein-anchoring transpeptidase ErfK/SrfK